MIPQDECDNVYECPGDDGADDGGDDGGEDCDSEVCLSLDGGDLNYSSTEDIAGFQFSHNGCVTGAAGGDAAANGFTVSASGSAVLGFSFTGSVIPAGAGTLVELSGGVSEDCLSEFIFSDANGNSLSVGFGSGSADDGGDDGSDDGADDGGDDGGEDCDSEVCLSLDGGDLNYSSTEDIAGFQFSHNGCVTGAAGGDAAANGFTVSASGSAVLGFSFTGSVIPAGAGTLVELSGGVSEDCLSEFIFSDANGNSLSVGFGSGSADDGGVDTCEDSNACNFGEEGDCEYAEEYFDCDGNCIVDTDCAGECGGSAQLDDCGECNGPGADYECWDGSVVCDSSDCPDVEVSYLDITYSSDTDIAGFQFDMEGVTVLGASGGDAEANGFSVSTSATTVLGFSFTGSVIPASENGVLTTLEVQGNVSDACIDMSSLVISGPGGEALFTMVDDCLMISASNEIGDGGDDGADDGGDDGGEDCDSEVCLSLDGGDLNYSSTEDIAGFQFSHNGCVTGAGGGDAAANGFTVSASGSAVLGFSFTGSVIPAGAGTLVELSGGVSEDCLSEFIFSDANGNSLSVGFGSDSADDGGDDGSDDGADDGGDDGGEDCDSEVCLSLDGGDLNYSSTEDIAGFQFSHNGCVTGAGGGDAAANGFTVSASGSAVLGFSFTGSVVPAGEGTLVELSGDVSQDCLSEFIFAASDGSELSVGFGSGSADDGGDDGSDDGGNNETASVQVIHNSASPTVDVYIDGALAVEDFEYRTATPVLELGTSFTVGIAPANGDVIAEFPFELMDGGEYVVVATGLLGNTVTPFDLAATSTTFGASDGNVGLEVYHGSTDAPAVDVLADGAVLVPNLSYGSFSGYVEVPAADYVVGIAPAGGASIADFVAPLSGLGGGSAVVFASGFLADDPAFGLFAALADGTVLELPVNDVSDDGGDDGGEDCDSEVCLSLDGGDLNYSSTEDIAGFQFSHNGCVTGAGGGDAAANGFTVSASGSAVLGFSFTGSVVPAGEGTLIELAGDVSQDCLSEFIFAASDGSELSVGFGSGSADDGGVDTCEDSNACNFGEEGDCEYAEEYFDCDGNCIVDTDCAGECGGSAQLDDCGECNGPGADYECWDGSVVCDSSDCPDEVLQPVYFTDLPNATGESSLIIIQDVLGLDIGDEIGLFDSNGVLDSCIPEEGCSNPEYGETLVASGVWSGEQLELVAVMSIDLSDFNGPVLNGAVDGNDIVIKVWDASLDYEHSSDPNYIQGNGTYGQILTVVDVLDAYVYGCTDPEALNFNEYANMDDGSCDYTIEQSIDLLSYQLNNISFNVNLWNSYDFEDALSSVDVLLAYNDMDEYYVPEFGINQVSPEISQGYYVFISGADGATLTVEEEAVDLNTPLSLQPYMMNNIGYFPQENRSSEDVFSGIPILLVSNDQGQYYVPSLGVNSIDAAGGMTAGEGYSVFLSGGAEQTLVYGEESLNRSTLEIDDLFLESQTRAYSDLVVPTGISYPVIITDIGGDVSVGDELVAYADGQVVGATRIVDLSAPVVISAWGGYHEFGIDLEGYDVGDAIDLRLFSNETGEEMKVEMSLDNTEYGIGVLSSGTIEVMDMLAVPEEYNLTQNYPNPFNPSTTISFSIPSEGFVQVNVYDITGRLITGLVNGNLSAGYHDVIWDGTDMFGSNVSAGLYIYSLQAEGVSLTRKMVLMK